VSSVGPRTRLLETTDRVAILVSDVFLDVAALAAQLEASLFPRCAFWFFLCSSLLLRELGPGRSHLALSCPAALTS
jgi:hypothetical protein